MGECVSASAVEAGGATEKFLESGPGRTIWRAQVVREREVCPGGLGNCGAVGKQDTSLGVERTAHADG